MVKCIIMMSKTKALQYHAQAPAGKLGIKATKPLRDFNDLTLAYTPGVAAPCQEIAHNAANAYTYTNKGNLVAIITNGTAVLGLGDIGPRAAKPVMEGKAILMKQLAGLDAFDLEIEEKDPERLVDIIRALAPTFGGINLEDIQSPACFFVEKALQDSLDIPVMHDDQHSTAIVIAAALKNALLLNHKKLADLKVVIHGAGASAIASAALLHTMGLPKSQLIMLDSQGVICMDRPNLPRHKRAFATEQKLSTLTEAIKGADFFLGLSVADVLTPSHLQSMAQDPIVFALANPSPEIAPALAHATRKDLLLGTGRSDHPNQVNNLLAFPFLFRGAMDVQATRINDAMKLAAVDALAQVVHLASKVERSSQPTFSKHYFIPSPLDKRLLTQVAPIVAQAAIKSGVARKPIKDWQAYEEHLKALVDFR